MQQLCDAWREGAEHPFLLGRREQLRQLDHEERVSLRRREHALDHLGRRGEAEAFAEQLLDRPAR
jgi:hypothetical protein